MTTYNLTTIRPRGFLHSSAFNEVKDSLAWALTALGHQANVTENWIDAHDTNIIFGAELLAPNQPQALPPGSVIYNLEQPTHPNLAKVKSIVQMTGCKVWDYSKTNFQMWREMGANVCHVPIGYTPNLTRIPKAPIQDIDVVMFAWLTPRRMEVIQSLKDAGLNVVASDKCYGGGRDNLISRAKVCLNVHHDGRTLFEIVRVSYLLANSKCIVSEMSDDDGDYLDIEGLTIVPYDVLVETCSMMAKSPELRRSMELHSLAAIQQRDYVATVAAALTEPTPQEKVAACYAKGSPDIGHYMQYLKDHAKGIILEIGVRDGASTSALLAGVEKNGGVVLSVDTADCSTLFAGHPNWKFIQSSSQNPKLKVPPLDLVFIDGDHTREGYRADLERFFPLVKEGGLIISHDIDPDPAMTLEHYPGTDLPSAAIREEYFKFAAEHGLAHREISGANGLGVMIKTQAEVIESDESWQASEAICR